MFKKLFALQLEVKIRLRFCPFVFFLIKRVNDRIWFAKHYMQKNKINIYTLINNNKNLMHFYSKDCVTNYFQLY